MSQAHLNDPVELEVLAGSVLGDLSEQESEQLASILGRGDHVTDLLEDLEKTAAGIQLCLFHGDGDPLPETLFARISAEGHRWVEQQADSDSAEQGIAAAARDSSGGQTGSVLTTSSASGVNRREWFAWFSAAAAIVLAVGLWSRSSSPTQLSASRARAEMLRNSESLIQVDWSAGKTPFDQSVTGDVVWDGTTQRGFMRFKNMPVNDPSVEQYQLWIIDPARDDEPIDGGVFDINESGEVVVEIDPKLEVIDPVAFAITIEKPGGVVVSTQERLPLLAAVE